MGRATKVGREAKAAIVWVQSSQMIHLKALWL